MVGKYLLRSTIRGNFTTLDNRYWSVAGMSELGPNLLTCGWNQTQFLKYYVLFTILIEGQMTETELGIPDARAYGHTICTLVFIETRRFYECGN
jgi:hypothetical protein